jgi:hypothetical protein
VQVRKYVGECDEGACPAVFVTDRDTYLFQGGTSGSHGLDVPMGEAVVEIPAALIRTFVRKVIADGLA